MSSVDLSRDAESADILNAIRKHIAENKSGNTSAANFTPEFILQFFNTINISNTVSLNGNKHEFANTVNLSNNAILRQFTKDRFLVCASDDEKYLNTGKTLVFTGSNSLSITKHTELQPTAAITLAVRAYLKGFTGTQRNVFHNQDANNGYIVYCQAGANNIVAEWYSGSALISSQTISFTPDTWTTFVFTFQSGNQDLYKNGSSADADTTVGTMTSSSADVGIGGTATGSNRMTNGDVFNNLVIIDRYVNSTWASDYNNNITKIDQSSDYLPACSDFCVAVA